LIKKKGYKEMDKLQNALKLEQSVQQMVAVLKTQLYKEISSVKLDGVNSVKKNMATVNISSLEDTVLSPSYYIPSSQADAVDKKLSRVKTASAFVNEIQKMVVNKSVKVGKNTTKLNSKTIEVLERYVSII
jgi:hypothetical protein